MAIKSKPQICSRPSVGVAGYVLLTYWVFFAIIYLTIDLFIDLYTDKDYFIIVWYAAAVALPLAACTLYIGRQSLFTRWYTYVYIPLIVFALYLASAYFTALKLDILISAAVKPVTAQVLPVKNVKQVFARKAGYIHANITLIYGQRPLIFEGTRTSYFLLKPYKSIQVKMGQSYLGSYYITRIKISDREKWTARAAYYKDWFYRYYWLMIGLPIMFMFSSLVRRWLPAPEKNVKPAKKIFKAVKLWFVIMLVILGLFLLVVLLAGLFA